MKSRTVIIAACILAVLMILYQVGVTTLQNVDKRTLTVRVTDKLRVSYGHIWNTHKYLIFAIDDETDTVYVLENTDSAPHLKYNSSDFFARIEVGKTYTFTTVGLRLPFLSMYRNIIGMELVEEVDVDHD